MSTEESKKNVRKGPRIVGTTVLLMVLIGAVWFGAARSLDAIMYVTTDEGSVDGEQVNLGSRILGRIDTIEVEEGARVAAGDVLATLDDTDLRAQEAQSQASLAYARQNLELARVNLNTSREDYNRMRNLYENDAATKEMYDHAGSGLEATQAQYNLAQAQVDTATAQMGVIEAQLLNMRIHAPISGTVDTINLSAGDVVQPSQSIMTINNLDDLWIAANIEETDIARVQVGAPVIVTVDAFGKREFPGTVEMVYPGIVAPAFQIGEFTKTTQRIPVRIRFDKLEWGLDDAGGVRLIPGMSVEVKVRTPSEIPAFVPDFLMH